MPACIYCRAQQDHPFEGVDHVIPEAFWPFDRPRYVLNCVCDKCNGYFGRDIEQLLARDSVEGLLRATLGLKTKQQGVRLGKKRLGITVAESSDWNGVPVFAERNSKEKSCTLRPYPTVAVRRRGDSGWKLVREADLKPEALNDYLPDLEVLVCGPNEQDTMRLQQKLADLGVKVKGWANEPRSGPALVFANSPCDDITLRAVAKIAVNFLAYIHGPLFVLEGEFDTIRQYTRDALVPRIPPVRNLGGGNGVRRRHAVVLNWDRQNRGILCLVTLFGYQLYQVTLCGNYPGPWRPLSAGRIFDLEKRRIDDIPGLDLWPPNAWLRQFCGDSIGSQASAAGQQNRVD